MSIVCFLCAGLCLCYFLLILLYSGIGTDFCGIWILIALFFLVMGFFSYRGKRNREEMPKQIPVFVYTTFFLALAVSVFLLLLIGRYALEPDTESCDYVIVIGDRVYEDGISSTLKKRLDKVLKYAENNPETVFVLSGGRDDGDVLPEALAMYNYLSLEGLPEKRMLIETESDTTVQNLQLSLSIIEEDLKTRMVPPPIMIGVLTSDYHMFRTVKTAEAVSQVQIYSITADSDPVMYVHQCVRECAAVVWGRLTALF